MNTVLWGKSALILCFSRPKPQAYPHGIHYHNMTYIVEKEQEK